MAAWSKRPTLQKEEWRDKNPATSVTGPLSNDDFIPKQRRPKSMTLKDALKARLIFDDSDPYLVVSIDGTYLFSNSKYVALAERSNKLLTLPADEETPIKVSSGIYGAIAEVEALEKPMSYNERIVIAGEERYFSTRYLPIFDDTARVIAVVVLFRDVTDESEKRNSVREIERKFSDFVRATADWYWEVDKNFRILNLSDRFTAMTGIPVAAAVGRRLDECVEVVDVEDSQRSLYESLQRKVPFRDSRILIKTDDGRSIECCLSGVPVFNPRSGDFTGFRGAGVEVVPKMTTTPSPRPVAKEALDAELLQRLEEKSARDVKNAVALERQTIEATIEQYAERMKEPLNDILGFADAMKKEVIGPLSDEYRSYSARMSEAGNVILDLINELASGETNVISMKDNNIEVVDLKYLLADARGKAFTRKDLAGMNLAGLTINTRSRVAVNYDETCAAFRVLFESISETGKRGDAFGIEIHSDTEATVDVVFWDSRRGMDIESLDQFFEDTQSVFSQARSKLRRSGGDLLIERAQSGGCVFVAVLKKAENR